MKSSLPIVFLRSIYNGKMSLRSAKQQHIEFGDELKIAKLKVEYLTKREFFEKHSITSQWKGRSS